MQGVRRRSTDFAILELSPSSSSPSASASVAVAAAPASLSIDESEPAAARIRRLIDEHPVIIFSRSACCMCHVMRRLLAAVGVQPTVIELDDGEIAELGNFGCGGAAPAVFIGGRCVGGLESLVALHLGGRLVPRLVEVGALWV